MTQQEATQEIEAILGRIEQENRQATSEELSRMEELRAIGAPAPPTPTPTPTPTRHMTREARTASQLAAELRGLLTSDNQNERLRLSISELRAVTFAESTGTRNLAPIIRGENRANLFARLNWVDAPEGNAAFTVYPAMEGAYVPMGTAATDGFSGTAKALTPKRLAAATMVPLASWEAATDEFYAGVIADLGLSLFRGVEKKLLDKNAGSPTAPAGIFTGTPTALAGATPTVAELMAMAGEVHAKTGDTTAYCWVMDAPTYYACMGLTIGQEPLVRDGRMLGFDVVVSAYAPSNLGAGTKKGIALLDAKDCFAVIYPDVIVRVDYSVANLGQVRLLAEATSDYAWARDGYSVRQLA